MDSRNGISGAGNDCSGRSWIDRFIEHGAAREQVKPCHLARFHVVFFNRVDEFYIFHRGFVLWFQSDDFIVQVSKLRQFGRIQVIELWLKKAASPE